MTEMTTKPIEPASGALNALRRGDWLDGARVAGWGRTLFIVEILAVLAIAAGTYGAYVHLDAPSSTDFISFFAAGRLADLGTAPLAYDPAAHYAMEQTVFGDPRLPYAYFFFYPPTFLLICAALALSPSYLAAFALWIGATGALFVLALHRIVKRWPLTIAFLSYPAMLATAGIGQNSLLTAALFGFGTYLIDRNPVASGLLLGAAVYKPHLLAMVPVAFLFGRHWRALAAFFVSASAITLLSLLFFGLGTWQAFLAEAESAAQSFTAGRVGYAGLISFFAAARLLGADAYSAYGLQIAVALLAALVTAWAWGRNLSLPVRALVLIAASLIAPHVILFYDLLPAAIAIAWLVIDARKTGFLPWEKALLCLVWIVPIVSRGIGIAWGAPVGPLATVALFGLAVARARNEARRPA